MGADHSSFDDQDSSDPPVFVRLGGNATSPLSNQELVSCARTTSQQNLSSFRAVNGDWYKRILPVNAINNNYNHNNVRVIVAKNLFVGTQPPSLEKVLILPVADGSKLLPLITTEEEPKRLELIIKKIRLTERIHLDVGDSFVVDETTFIVVDVEPEGGGVVDRDTTIFAAGSALQSCKRVKFSPSFGSASDVDRDRFRNYLTRRANALLLKVNLSVVDDYNKTWIVMEIDDEQTANEIVSASSSTQNEEQQQESKWYVLSIGALGSIGYQSEVLPRTTCSHCFRQVTLPSVDFAGFAFACPMCGFLVSNPNYRVWIEAETAAATPARQLLFRFRAALSDIHRTDPRTLMLDTLVNRLPRLLDGSLNWRLLDEVAVRVLTGPANAPATNATPEEVLQLLPVSKYQANGPEDQQEASRPEERCEICLESYQEGASVRTLPCFHRFHESCSDSWLQVSKACPLCKTEVDVIISNAQNEQMLFE